MKARPYVSWPLILALLLSVLTTVRAQPRPFLIEGWVTNDVPADPSMQRVDFQLRTDGLKWLVRLSGPLGPGHYREVFYDGEKTCYLNNLKALVEEKRASGQQVGYNVATAMIRAGPTPYFPLAQEAGIVWLTYLSGRFFAAERRLEGFISPPCQAGILGFGHVKFEDLVLQKYYRTPDIRNSFGVPSRVEYSFATSNHSDPALREVQRRLYSRTNAIFTLLDSTDIGGAVVPVLSKLVVTVPPELGLGVRPAEFFLYATNIVAGATVTNLVAKIPGLTHFTDARFVKGGKPLLISYRGSKWLSDGEVKSLPEYRKAVAIQPSPLSPSGTGLVVGVFVLLALFPVVLARARKRQRKVIH